MTTEYSYQAIQSVLTSEMGYCKFLSANDTGATRSHQSGILISRSAREMLFSREEINQGGVVSRTVRIKWQDDRETNSSFTYYESKGELRVTRFGHGFPFLGPEQAGSLFVLTKQGNDDYKGYFLETEAEMNAFLDAFGISATETNKLIDRRNVPPGARETLAIRNFIDHLGTGDGFPTSEVMSAGARHIENEVYDHDGYVTSDPDYKIISWTNVEFALFRALECARYGEILRNGFTSVDDFVELANKVLNRRKSRAGKSFEHQLAAIFDGNGLHYSAQPVTEGNKRPDFIFPSIEAYHNLDFPVNRLMSLAAKTTCKDRWRQVLNEADRLRDGTKYLCTLQQSISEAQMDEMQNENVVLVVPRQYIDGYPSSRRERILTLQQFVARVRAIEE